MLSPDRVVISYPKTRGGVVSTTEGQSQEGPWGRASPALLVGEPTYTKSRPHPFQSQRDGFSKPLTNLEK